MVLVLLGGKLRQRLGFPDFSWPLPVPLTAFCALALASALWSIDPVETLNTIWPLSLMFLGGLVVVETAGKLNEVENSFFLKAVIAGGIVGFAFMAWELFTNAAISRAILELMGKDIDPLANYKQVLNSSVAVAALYVWPWTLALYRRHGKVSALIGFIVISGILSQGGTETPLLAVLLGLSLAIAYMALPKVMPFLVAGVLIAGVAGGPSFVESLPSPLTESKKISFLSNSAAHRLMIWQTAADHISQNPLLGHGFDSSRSLYDDGDKIVTYFAQDDPPRAWANLFEPIPLHPHNGVLQVWLELGGVGAALLLGALLSLLYVIVRWSAGGIETAACMGLFASSLFIFSVSFGAWQSWWQATLWLSGIFMVAGLAHGTKPPVAPISPRGENTQ